MHYATAFEIVNRTRRVSIDVMHGICFCSCIVRLSGVFDSKSKATRWQTKVRTVKRSYFIPFSRNSWHRACMNQDPLVVFRHEKKPVKKHHRHISVFLNIPKSNYQALWSKQSRNQHASVYEKWPRVVHRFRFAPSKSCLDPIYRPDKPVWRKVSACPPSSGICQTWNVTKCNRSCRENRWHRLIHTLRDWERWRPMRHDRYDPSPRLEGERINNFHVIKILSIYR